MSELYKKYRSVSIVNDILVPMLMTLVFWFILGLCLNMFNIYIITIINVIPYLAGSIIGCGIFLLINKRLFTYSINIQVNYDSYIIHFLSDGIKTIIINNQYCIITDCRINKKGTILILKAIFIATRSEKKKFGKSLESNKQSNIFYFYDEKVKG